VKGKDKQNKKLDKVNGRHMKVYSERTVDEIKERYYSVSKIILENRGLNDHPIVKKPFNYEQEVKRKCNLEKLFLRTKD
jgi:hypothetical protein